ncbi:MAG: hypothetical protein HN430_06570, partial [Halieaceae bacterium]|nr:hypothetical protein [Halieaceae bacterium]
MNSNALIMLALILSLATLGGCTRASDDTITVFTARSIISMNPQAPTAEAIAIRGDTIVAIGNLANLREELRGQTVRVDERFDDKVIMPGFIDPHIHPSIAATILPMEIVAAMAWPT